jgi:hypothetical protein
MNINNIVYQDLVIHETYYRKNIGHTKSMLYIYCYYLNDNIGKKDFSSFLLTYTRL